MSILPISDKRSVIPRWRRSNTFQQAPESNAVRLRAPPVDPGSWFERSYADWLEDQGPGFLADALSAAIVEGRKGHFSELAHAVLGHGDAIPIVLQRLAARLLKHDPRPEIVNSGLQEQADPEILQRAIAYLRKRLGTMPRNPFLWHDLSYSYLMLGEREKAERAMSTALGVGKNHRLIARSASRMFVHIDKSDKALRVLASADGFRSDPWLLSAHVAVSQGISVPSKFLKNARGVLEESGVGIEKSELGMAIATEELLHGKAKKAKAFAREASLSPTENSLAQGVWLSKQLNVDIVVDDVSTTTDAYEAQAWDAYYKGDWAQTLRKSILWLEDQPFSSRPATLGSFVASTFVRDFVLCEQIARFALRTNPGDWLLTNNLTVALAEQDRTEEARRQFSQLEAPSEASPNYAVWLATNGLVEYRGGNQESGRHLYAQSYEASKSRRDRASQLLGALYQSMEEARLGDTNYAAELLTRAQSELGSVDPRERELAHAIQRQIEEMRLLRAPDK